MSPATATSQADGFLEAICAWPEDDAPRLVYADWLEEQGDPRGEFIRVQCEVDRLCRKAPSYVDCGNVDCAGCIERRSLLSRERELFARFGYFWGDLLPGTHSPYHCGINEQTLQVAFGKGIPEVQVAFRRGLVESIVLTSTDWVRHGPALVKVAPLTKVTLNDVEPLRITEGPLMGMWLWLGWSLVAPGSMPAAPSRARALAQNSAACVGWARDQAGLPTLRRTP